MAMAARPIEVILNIKWPFHDKAPIIPPQLQGSFLSILKIAITYSVKEIISPNEAYNPFKRHWGINSKTDIMNSVVGNRTVIIGATGPKAGESPSCSLKTGSSMSLLIPVYRNKTTKNNAIISMMVVRFITNIFRFAVKRL
jgi:hypothetical protein